MCVGAMLLASLLIIKTNFAIVETSNSTTPAAENATVLPPNTTTVIITTTTTTPTVSNITKNAGDNSSELQVATTTVSAVRKRTKFQGMLTIDGTGFSYMDVGNGTTNSEDFRSAVIRRLSDQFGRSVRDMMHAWSWVPKWWQRFRQWTNSTRNVLSKRCLEHQHRSSMLTIIGGPLLLCAFLPTITGQLTEPEPEFLAPLENHTVTQGREVYFTCVVNHLSSYKVAWIKSDTKAILAIHTHMVAQNQRLSVTHNGHNTWKLHVSNVQKNDSGTYMCQINTDPMRSQMGTLEVVIPPDILNDNESTEGGGVAVEGGTVRLKCHATGVPEPSVLWRREDSRSLVLRHDGGREKQVLRSFDGETLVLSNIQRADMGAYLCIASNGVPPSVSKRFSVRVHFHPLIRVSNQLVAAPVASDVVVQCYVEASPRAMNHWTRDTGEKLIPNDKYAMEETIINEYSLLMNLTIRSLEKRDFGGYVCTSSNALGKAEGVVRLQELHLIVKTTTTTAPPRRIESKPRKPTHKEKPTKKYTRPTKGRKSPNGGDDDDAEPTKSTQPDAPRTLPPPQTATPGASHSPPWVLHHNRSGGTPHANALLLLVLIGIRSLLLRHRT